MVRFTKLLHYLSATVDDDKEDQSHNYEKP